MYEHTIKRPLCNTNVDQYTSRSVLTCTLDDILNALVPIEFVRGRNILHHFMYTYHDQQIIPIKVIKYYHTEKDAVDQIMKIEHRYGFKDEIIDGIHVAVAEHLHTMFIVKEIQSTHFSMENIIKAHMTSIMYNIAFMDVKTKDIIDPDPQDVKVYFLDQHDYKNYSSDITRKLTH